MSLPACLTSMIAPSAPKASAMIRLDAVLRQSPMEVCMWNRDDALTCDGTPLEEVYDLVFLRAMELLHVETLAGAVAQIISVIVPLADDMDEVDAAIRETARWVESITEGSTAEDIISVTESARETNLLSLTHDDFETDESKASFDAAIEYYNAMAEKAVCKMTFSGKDATAILDEDGIVIAIELEGADWAVVCLIPHQPSDGDGGWDDEGEPEPDPAPTSPETIDA